jgi:hypothetical protein
MIRRHSLVYLDLHLQQKQARHAHGQHEGQDVRQRVGVYVEHEPELVGDERFVLSLYYVE